MTGRTDVSEKALGRGFVLPGKARKLSAAGVGMGLEDATVGNWKEFAPGDAVVVKVKPPEADGGAGAGEEGLDEAVGDSNVSKRKSRWCYMLRIVRIFALGVNRLCPLVSQGQCTVNGGRRGHRLRRAPHVNIREISRRWRCNDPHPPTYRERASSSLGCFLRRHWVVADGVRLGSSAPCRTARELHPHLQKLVSLGGY